MVPILLAIFRRDGVGVVPEIEAVYVTVIEPNAGVVGMIDALAGAGRERISADDINAVRGDQGKSTGFFNVSARRRR